MCIRQAERRDIGRICEILVFVKRVSYRDIFHDDDFSFNIIQVLTLADEFLRGDIPLSEYWVYDDGIVKGLIRVRGCEIVELYVDVFFQGGGIGGALLRHAVEVLGARWLWALEKNVSALGFYNANGFFFSGERVLEEGTPEYLIKLRRMTEDEG